MKKIILALTIAASSVVFGQKIGIKAGANISNISSGGSINDTEAKVGFNAGVFVNVPLLGGFRIQPELIYNKLGAKTTINIPQFGDTPINNIPKVENTMDLDYLSIPIMAQYHILPSLLYVEAGPEFSVLLGSSLSHKNVRNELNNIINDFNEAFKKENLNTMNFGIAMGAGVNISKQFGVNARYVAGITDSTKKLQASHKNSVVQVGVLYSF